MSSNHHHDVVKEDAPVMRSVQIRPSAPSVQAPPNPPFGRGAVCTKGAQQDDSHNTSQTQQSPPAPDLSLPAAIIFDFDGTILDTEFPEYESWRAIYQKEGFELSISTWAQCVGSDYDMSWSPEKHLEQLTGQTFDWSNVVHPPRAKAVREVLETAGPRPGIRDAIHYFHQHKIPLAIASSSEHSWVDMWLEKLGLMQYFRHHIICSDDVEHCKPAPDLFLKAAKSVGKEPHQCWAIEDSANGCKAATTAGCSVIITHHPITAHLDFSGAFLVEGSMEKVLERIKAANTPS